MIKKLTFLAGLAMCSGVATAAPPALPPLPAPLNGILLGEFLAEGADFLDFTLGQVGTALLGEHSDGGTDPVPFEGAGSGLLGGNDLLGDVLRGLGGELHDGSTEGGEYLGNTLNNVLFQLTNGLQHSQDSMLALFLLLPELNELLGGLPGLPTGAANPLAPVLGLLPM
ncbi:MAG: hypothetical protein L0H83_11700 [Salinisphaera sp.]|nr:hypothetical protein [Salinisphaera sp.]